MLEYWCWYLWDCCLVLQCSGQVLSRAWPTCEPEAYPKQSTSSTWKRPSDAHCLQALMSRLHRVTSCGAPGFQVFPIPRFPILRHCRKTVGRQNRQPRQRRGKRRTAKTAKTKTPSFTTFFSCREQPPKPPKCFDLRDHRKPAVAFRRIPKHENVQHNSLQLSETKLHLRDWRSYKAGRQLCALCITKPWKTSPDPKDISKIAMSNPNLNLKTWNLAGISS